VPAADFVQQVIPGGQRVQIGAGIIAFNQYGRTANRLSQKFTLNFNGDRLSKAPSANLSFDQNSNSKQVLHRPVETAGLCRHNGIISELSVFQVL
jgi:hypothetical protein